MYRGNVGINMTEAVVKELQLSVNIFIFSKKQLTVFWELNKNNVKRSFTQVMNFMELSLSFFYLKSYQSWITEIQEKTEITVKSFKGR